MSRLVGVLIVALCAYPLAVAAQVQQGTPLSVRLPAYDTPVNLDTMETLKHHEDVMREAVFVAARQALQELTIDVTYADSARGIVLNPQITAMRRIGKYRMGQILECGNNLNGAIADQFRIRMAVAVVIDSIAPSKSEFRVLIAASAQSPEGVSRPPLACGTTGFLEERIAKLIDVTIWGS